MLNASKRRLAIIRFAKPERVIRYAVFLAKPRWQRLLQPEAVLGSDVERMLDLGADAGLDRFELVTQPVDFLAHVQRAPFARLGR